MNCITFVPQRKIMEEQNQQQNQLNIEITEEVAEGSYANLAIITHSNDNPLDFRLTTVEQLEHFAQLVAQAEREACIELTDSRCQCAWAIKARGDKHD